jgi:uncharacterized protein YndB with AHSA1/START domain
MSEVKNKKYTLEVKYIIYAEPDKVFESVTQEAKLEEWCEGGGKVEPFVGGEMKMFDGWVEGEVLKFNKLKRELSYTWKSTEWGKKKAPSVVEFSFDKNPAGTLVKVIHFDFPNQAESDKHKTGWVDYFFEPLNDHIIG